MDFLKNKFLLYPFWIFLFAFALDKAFLLEGVHTYFSKTLSDINYIQKNDLYESLKTYLNSPNRKKVLVYFGNSRALLFDNVYIESNYPGWTLYNFSVPGGKPDYTLQWAEVFQKDGVKPDFVLIDQSAELYNSTATLKVDETLTNGLDVFFVLKHWNKFSTEEKSTLLAKRLFRTYQYRPKLDVIIKRASQKEIFLYPYQALRAKFIGELAHGQGSAKTPGTHHETMPSARLKKSAFGDFHSYLVPFTFNERTFQFYKEASQIFKQMNVPQASIWVRLSLPYMELIRTQPVAKTTDKSQSVYSAWLPLVLNYQESVQIPFWNMNDDPDYNCNEFSDAGHMAPTCYRDYTDFILKRVTKTQR